MADDSAEVRPTALTTDPQDRLSVAISKRELIRDRTYGDASFVAGAQTAWRAPLVHRSVPIEPGDPWAQPICIVRSERHGSPATLSNARHACVDANTGKRLVMAHRVADGPTRHQSDKRPQQNGPSITNDAHPLTLTVIRIRLQSFTWSLGLSPAHRLKQGWPDPAATSLRVLTDRELRLSASAPGCMSPLISVASRIARKPALVSSEMGQRTRQAARACGSGIDVAQPRAMRTPRGQPTRSNT